MCIVNFLGNKMRMEIELVMFFVGMDRGTAGTRNIFSAIGSVKEAIKEKLTMPSDIVEETQAAREYGGTKRATAEKVVLDDEGNPVDEYGRVHSQRVERQE